MGRNLLFELSMVFSILLICEGFAAQNEIRVISDDSEIVLTIWAGNLNPQATILLVPGWGGGPEDVLGIGQALSESGIPVVVLTPRGWHESDGISTFANALDDIETSLAWIKKSNDLILNSNKIILGGHSWGGGMSLAYAARDTTVANVFSIAGTDHGQFIRQYESDDGFASMVDKILASTSVPEGKLRFDVEFGMNEMKENQEIYGLLENTEKLSNRNILLVGGWEDVNVTVDDTLLPLYRALRKSGAKNINFLTYHSNHSFNNVRGLLHSDLLEWITR